VVGINSFKDNGNYVYPKGPSEPNPPDHVVFQFQNVPVRRWMNPPIDEGTNAGGYPASEMREYLAPGDGAGGSGKFLAGLKNAGVPEEVLWGPSRVMATKNEGSPTETINDLLWLPTEREMFGVVNIGNMITNFCAKSETAENQARLEYYDATGSYYKAVNNGAQTNTNCVYWLASAVQDSVKQFCTFTNNTANKSLAGSENGISPAFCVYGWPKSQQ
jgi:hypothetical protein